MDKIIDTKDLTEFDRRLFYSMQIACVSRAISEGLFPIKWEAEKLKTIIRENYYRETGHRL